TDVTLFASLRQRIYGDFNAVLGERRDDTEQNYTLVVTLPELFAGFQPLIEVKANQTKSNVDWAYSYKQHQYSLKLEKRF
ncbi:surface lipoprotein assembly modifier, partial [Vibrio neptunius]